MRIVDALRDPRPCYSFEFFPPQDQAGADRLFETLRELQSFSPTYVSITYGAGGSTRQATIEWALRMKNELGLRPMVHLTCVGATRFELQEVILQLSAEGIANVLALRGDPPKGQQNFQAVEGGLLHASELVTLLRQQGDFCIAGACYPEVHPEALSADSDLDALRAKVDAGTDFLITQLFFEDEDYFRLVERAQQRGILVPIVAGIMPITNLAQVKRFTQMCGARLPAKLLARLEACGEDRLAVEAVGIEHAIEQCSRLVEAGVPGIHFYTLNRSTATRRVLAALRAE